MPTSSAATEIMYRGRSGLTVLGAAQVHDHGPPDAVLPGKSLDGVGQTLPFIQPHHKDAAQLAFAVLHSALRVVWFSVASFRFPETPS